MRKCANCGEPIRLSDGRYKYCSDECYKEAHRRQCRENARRRYWANPEKKLAQNRQYYYEQKKVTA